MSCELHLGRGASAIGGWVFDETFKRHVRLYVSFAPTVAKCLLSFFGCFALIYSSYKLLYLVI